MSAADPPMKSAGFFIEYQKRLWIEAEELSRTGFLEILYRTRFEPGPLSRAWESQGLRRR